MKQSVTSLSQEISPNYYCINCDYNTFRYSDYKKHLQTIKHNETICNKKLSKTLTCLCGLVFNNRTSLWRHKKKCLYTKDNDDNSDDEEMMIDGINIKDKDALVFHLLKQNSDLQNKIIDMFSKTNNTNSHNNTNNSYNTTNKTFNLQFFLNETCKNAMNISDFVSSIKMELDDLEHTGRTNYVEGISSIVIKNLNSLEKQLRPLHCSDHKREVLYIKDNDQWTKETNNKPILTNAIKKIANENIKQINKWVQKYPDCVKADSNKNDLYLKIVSNSMIGLTKEEGDKNINKIISNVAKNVIIDK
jgi:hypothetical protein